MIANCDFDYETLEDLKNVFQGQYNANPPKQNSCHNDQG